MIWLFQRRGEYLSCEVRTCLRDEGYELCMLRPDGQTIEWYPDGKSILFATSRTSEKDRFNQLYKIPAAGGLPEKLPVPSAVMLPESANGRYPLLDNTHPLRV